MKQHRFWAWATVCCAVMDIFIPVTNISKIEKENQFTGGRKDVRCI